MTKETIRADLDLQIEYEDNLISNCLKDLAARAERGGDLSDEIRRLTEYNAARLRFLAQREIISKLDN